MEFEICEECELAIDIDIADLANYQHAMYCSLYPDTIED